METTLTTPHSLTEKDRAYVWHPFTQAKTAFPPIPIVRGKGIYLYSEEGKPYLDGISSWWVNLHGHAHPYIVEKIKSQLDQLEHVLFADFNHPPALDLAARLIPLLPGNMSKIFYSDNGSTAVETALKMVVQYWYNKNPNTHRTKIICFKNSYHGDTFGAMSAAGRSAFNKPFWKHLFDVEAIEPPLRGREQESLTQLKHLLNQGNVAGFIFEPLVLAVGGMTLYPAEGLDRLLQCCKDYDVLTIADEVMTGFGRTGSLFACEQLQESPDLICLAKGLTGGFLPLAATACNERVFNAFLSDRLDQAFIHGHSYTANPLACVSALASLDLLLENTCSQQRERIATCHQTFCHSWSSHPKLKRCESLGTLLVLEYRTEKASYFEMTCRKFYRFFLDQGILLRPLGNVLYVLAPYCIQNEELERIYEHIIFTLEKDI
jgi:adenosylmethionine-8-amino-7-oxononanoate aminotransferase